MHPLVFLLGLMWSTGFVQLDSMKRNDSVCMKTIQTKTLCDDDFSLSKSEDNKCQDSIQISIIMLTDRFSGVGTNGF